MLTRYVSMERVKIVKGMGGIFCLLKEAGAIIPDVGSSDG